MSDLEALNSLFNHDFAIIKVKLYFVHVQHFEGLRLQLKRNYRILLASFSHLMSLGTSLKKKKKGQYEDF